MNFRGREGEAKRTGDRRALYCSQTGRRRYASWDDRGEVRPFDDAGPDLLVSVRLPEGLHLVSLYLVDWDWHEGPHPRMQTVTVLDRADDPLAVVATGKFGGGQYERFLTRGPRELTLRISKHRSPCAMLSGLFVDKVEALREPPFGTPHTPGELPELSERFDRLVDLSVEAPLHLVEGGRLEAFRGTAGPPTRATTGRKPPGICRRPPASRPTWPPPAGCSRRF